MKKMSFSARFEGRAGAIVTDCSISTAYLQHPVNAHPPVIDVKCVWDTGAVMTTISNETVRKLKLKPVARTESYHAFGKSSTEIYYINLILPSHTEIAGLKVIGAELPDTDVLIGMDVIGLCDMAISHVDNETLFSYRIPSCGEIII